MLSQNDRGGNYSKFKKFVRENHKPKLGGERAGDEEYGAEDEFSFFMYGLCGD